MNNPLLEKILKAKKGLDAQNVPRHFPNNPLPEPFKPDQEEMDKLASTLTEAVLQLRAGDMDGARKTLMDADYQCGMRIHTQIPPTDYYLDAVRYEMGVAELKTPIIPEWTMSATEMKHRQQIAKRQMRMIQEEMLDNLNNTISPIIKDPGA